MKMKTKILMIGLILAIIFYGNFIYQKRRLHVNVSLISEKFISRANKNERHLYAKRTKLDPAFIRSYDILRSQIEIDIVIPVVEKDLETVVYTIESIRKLVNHKIGKIYLVAPNQQKIKDFAETYKCEFIDEDTVLPAPAIKKHGGWILQQFLKLNMENIVQKDHYLVVDADTFFLRPVVFIRENAYLINVQWNCDLLRKRITSKFLNNKQVYAYDFVAHHMLFSKKILQQMKEHIEKTHGDKWYNVFLKSFETNKTHRDGFSEYELYATYLTEFTKEKFRFVSNANITVYRNFLGGIDKIMPAYAGEYKTISAHGYIDF
ncbi:MAG: DUF6492 family protein [Gammaproteobacteria bacterium]|jgi:hypothetical protein